MLSPKKTSKEIQAEINALTRQLEQTLRLEIGELNQKVQEGEAKYQALLKRMIRRQILITKKEMNSMAWKQSLPSHTRRARSLCIGGSELQPESKPIKQRPALSYCRMMKRKSKWSSILANRTLLSCQRVIDILLLSTTTACVHYSYRSATGVETSHRLGFATTTLRPRLILH